MSTMDALLSVMDDGTSEPEEQAPATASSGREVPAAVLEAAAELSEGGSSYNPEDAMRYGLLLRSHGAIYGPGLPTQVAVRLSLSCCTHLPYPCSQTVCLHSCCSHACSAHQTCLCSAPLSRYASTVVPAAPELEALLSAAEASGGSVSLEQLQALFSFRLDDFQAQAVQVLLNGRSVVVCAPTGG